MRGNIFVADQTRDFSDQIFLDLQIEAEARRRDDEGFAVAAANANPMRRNASRHRRPR